MPLIITLDFDYDNDFYIEFIYNDRQDKSRIKRVIKIPKEYLIWAKNKDDEDGGFLSADLDDEQRGIWFPATKNNVMFTLFGVLPFTQLQIRIFPKASPQEFGIKLLALNRVQFKTKSIG